VTPEIETWLNDAPFDWRAEVTDRIGARFDVMQGVTVDVSADR